MSRGPSVTSIEAALPIPGLRQTTRKAQLQCAAVADDEQSIIQALRDFAHAEMSGKMVDRDIRRGSRHAKSTTFHVKHSLRGILARQCRGFYRSALAFTPIGGKTQPEITRCLKRRNSEAAGQINHLGRNHIGLASPWDL